MTSAVLIGDYVGFISSGVRDIASRGLYAFKDTKGPMITGFFAVGANVLFSIILSKYIGIMGVAIASSICLTVNFVINSLMLRKYLPEYSLLSLIPILLKQVPGVIALVIIILTVKKVFSNSILVFGVSALIGLSVYVIILSFMKIEEINLIKEKVTNKIFHR